MNTTAAALEAHVTAATIRTWCRNGVIAALKQAGRWIINAASLAHRIAIGTMRRKQTAMTHPIHTQRASLGRIVAVGHAATLQAAFEAGTPVTLTGIYEGDQVRLGITQPTYGDYGITQETLSVESSSPDGTQAAYYIDLTQLSRAPRLAAAIDRADEAAAAEDARIAAADDDYLNPDYE